MSGKEEGGGREEEGGGKEEGEKKEREISSPFNIQETKERGKKGSYQVRRNKLTIIFFLKKRCRDAQLQCGKLFLCKVVSRAMCDATEIDSNLQSTVGHGVPPEWAKVENLDMLIL